MSKGGISKDETPLVKMHKISKVSNEDDEHKDGSSMKATPRPLPNPPKKSTDETETTPPLEKKKLPPIEKKSESKTFSPKREKNQSTNTPNEEQNATVCEIKEGYMLLALMAVILIVMIAGVLSVSTTRDISNVKPCELERALDFLNLSYNPHPCKYSAIKDKSSSLSDLCIGMISFNVVIFVFISLQQCRFEYKDNVFAIIFAVVIVVASVFVVIVHFMYNDIIDIRDEDLHIDYVRLQSKMVLLLRQHYKSDNISTGDDHSTKWNNFFIQYDCCAVREVLGTANDFDNTPWCTTSGSCQATSSQIPKTCCKDVTQDDYQNAQSDCHASVKPGTYKPSCISRMRALGTVNITEYQLAELLFSLLIILVFKIFESILAIVLLSMTILKRVTCKQGLKGTKGKNPKG